MYRRVPPTPACCLDLDTPLGLSRCVRWMHDIFYTVLIMYSSMARVKGEQSQHVRMWKSANDTRASANEARNMNSSFFDANSIDHTRPRARRPEVREDSCVCIFKGMPCNKLAPESRHLSDTTAGYTSFEATLDQHRELREIRLHPLLSGLWRMLFCNHSNLDKFRTRLHQARVGCSIPQHLLRCRRLQRE
jgi:hypothetical protein